jgi:hypothetical protein
MRTTLRRLILIVSITILVPTTFFRVIVTQPMLPDRQETGSIKVDSARLEAHVRMLSESFFPRDEDNPENLDRCAFYIREEFERAGARVVDQPFDVETVSYRNIIAHFGPETKDRIIVGAHYDACGEHPGADDNASGTAGLIELAHLLKNTALKTHVELVAYTLEEPPYFGTRHMGSAVHAESLRRENVRVRIMVALEMIGYFTDAEGSQEFPVPLFGFFYPSQGNFIGVVGKLDQISAVRRAKRGMRRGSRLPVYSINAPALMPGIDFSDHRNYWQAGYDAVMITDTAFYRNRNYHTSKDTPDTLDYRRMAMVVQGVYGLIGVFDEQE